MNIMHASSWIVLMLVGLFVLGVVVFSIQAIEIVRGAL